MINQKKYPCNLVSIAIYVPKHIVRNDAFADRFKDINEDYILKVTGIEERRGCEV